MLSVGTLHQPATLVDDTTAAQFEEMLRLVVADFFFKLIARQSGTIAMALYGEPRTIVTGTHTHRSRLARHVALLDMA